eukprot:g13419.t1
MTTQTDLKHVTRYWKDEEAAACTDGLDRLVYRSNSLGNDQRVTNTGGGNTSSKIEETDPLTGETTEVLWVKGSGGDLRTSKRANFAALEMNKLNQLKTVYANMPNNGIKTPAEDEMVALYRHCTYNLNPRASSIDTPLHAFVPHKFVDHTHPNSLISVAASANGPEVMKEIFGDDLFWLPWMRPGFELGLALEKGCAEHPNAKGAIMGQHGLINWADDDQECYELSLDLINKAAEYIEEHDKGDQTFGGAKYQSLGEEDRNALLVKLLPWLRGKVSTHKRMIGTVQADDKILRFVNSNDAARLADLGTSCPDHFLRTKIKPLFVDWDPASGDLDKLKAMIESAIEKYVADYTAYYEACKHDNSPAMRQPNPTVVLIPGVGMIAWGKNKSESRVTAEFYNCAVEVMRGAEAIGGYIALPQQEAFDIEYWLLEEAKLQRMPPDKPLAGHISVVVGGGSGIGRATAHRLMPEDAHVVAADLAIEGAEETAKEITDQYGVGIGVAGTGISGCGPAIGLGIDMTDRAACKAMLEQVILAYGGIDDIIITAGLFAAPDDSGIVPDILYKKSYEVNVVGPTFLSEEAGKIFAEQDMDGCAIVITTSVNAVVAKPGSIAYDTSKAASNHLIRELAVTFAPKVRVNGVAPATVIEGSKMFPRERVMASLSKYSIEFDKSESDESLLNKLGRFYASRNLLDEIIRPADQAEAIFQMLGPAFKKTTGAVIHVDGGLKDAFLR